MKQKMLGGAALVMSASFNTFASAYGNKDGVYSEIKPENIKVDNWETNFKGFFANFDKSKVGTEGDNSKKAWDAVVKVLGKLKDVKKEKEVKVEEASGLTVTDVKFAELTIGDQETKLAAAPKKADGKEASKLGKGKTYFFVLKNGTITVYANYDKDMYLKDDGSLIDKALS